MTHPGIQRIEHQGKLLCIVVRAGFSSQGISFFTPPEFSQQLAYMRRPPGHEVVPHVHCLVPRNIEHTQEVLVVRSGRVLVDIYSEERRHLESMELGPGDVILLAGGGHGLRFLDESEIIEVKQGPYCGDGDKIRFTPETRP